MFDPDLPFRHAQALDTGMTPPEVRRQFTRVLGGIYISRRAAHSPVSRVQAALLAHPVHAVASHASAARLLGAPNDLDPDEHVTVREARDRRQRLGIKCHVTSLRRQDVRLMGGLRVTVPERTFLDLAGTLPLIELVVLGDWMVAQGHTTPGSLVQFCRTTPARYAGRAASAAEYVRAGVDSPSESRLRMLLVLAGLPEPTVNFEIRDADGTVIVRIDLVYEAVRLAVEYDGRQHLESVRQWERDVERADFFGDRSWRHLRITAQGLYRDPESTVRRVWTALHRLGYPGLRPPSDAWRRHFRP
jgi:very-short-patch-repair endonuclease